MRMSAINVVHMILRQRCSKYATELLCDGIIGLVPVPFRSEADTGFSVL